MQTDRHTHTHTHLCDLLEDHGDGVKLDTVLSVDDLLCESCETTHRCGRVSRVVPTPE